MTLKQNSQTLENQEENYSKSEGTLAKGIKSFMSRNSLNEGHFCERCLKAHIIAKSRELEIKKLPKQLIKTFSKIEIGHNGYYLDENKLVKI